MQDVIEEYQGDLWEWDLAVTGVDETTGEEAPVDLTGMTVLSTIKRSLDDADEDAVHQAEVTAHVDAGAGLSRIAMESAVTGNIALGEYYVDVKLVPGPHTLWVGQLLVRRPSTRRTN